jgi:hypothetical protein
MCMSIPFGLVELLRSAQKPTDWWIEWILGCWIGWILGFLLVTLAYHI